MENNAKTEQDESESGITDSSARELAVPSSGHPQSGLGRIGSSTRDLRPPSQQPRQPITGSTEIHPWQVMIPSSEYDPSGHSFMRTQQPASEYNQPMLGSMDSSWQNRRITSPEIHQSGPGAIGTSTHKVSPPATGHRRSITGSQEGSSRQLTLPSQERRQSGPGVIESSTRNVIVPESERSRSIISSKEGSSRQLTIPSSEHHQSGPAVIDSSMSNVIVPESECSRSITGSKETSSRQLTIPSQERRQSGPGIIESSTRNVIVPESERSRSIISSKEGSSRQLTIPSSEHRQSGPGIIDSGTWNVTAPSEHHQSITGSKESSSRQLTIPSQERRQSGPGIIESSTRNVIVPESERSRSITGSKESSSRQLTIPSSERRQSGPGVIDSSTRNVIVPESEHSRSISGSKESSSRQLTIPSSERRQSGPGIIDSSTRNVIVPESEHSRSISGSNKSSSRQLTIPSSERRQSGPGIIGSSTRNVIAPGSQQSHSTAGTVESSSGRLMVPMWESQQSGTSANRSGQGHLASSSPGSWSSILSGVEGNARRHGATLPEHRKSISPSWRSSKSDERSGTKGEHRHPRRSVVNKLALLHRGTLTKAMTRPKTQRRSYELTRPLLMITVITSFGSSFQHGYNLWAVTHPSRLIEDFYNTTYHLKNSVGIDKGFLTILYSLTLAMFSMGGLIGSLLFSPIVDKFGRKGALMLNNFLSMGSSVLMGLSATIRAYEYTIFSRMVNGICTGIFACAVPLYLAEVSPKNLRGGIMTVSRIFVVVGILCCQILALPELLGNINEWPILLSIPGGMALFQVLILPFFPESPRFLLIQKRKEESARQALQMLRCQLNVDQEIEELYQEDQAEKAEKVMSGMKIICYRGLRWQVVSVIILMSGQQLSGFSAAYFLSDRIYMTMSIYATDIQYIDVLSTFSLLLSLIIVMYIIDTVGRRLLILLGFGMCSILCVLLTMTLELQTTMSWMAYISASLVFVFFVGHVIGPGAVPQVIIAELFLQSSRSTAFSLGGFMYWLISLLTGVIFRQVESKIGSYSFLLFWPLCFGIFFYIFKIIPETKGKTFLDIRRLMNVHVNVARKIQVQGFGMDTKPTDAKAMDTKPTDTKAKGTKPIVKKLKKGRMGQKSGKKKKRKKSSTGEITK